MASWYSPCDYNLHVFGLQPYWLVFTADSPCDAVNSVPDDGFPREFNEDVYWDAAYQPDTYRPLWWTTEVSSFDILTEGLPYLSYPQPYWTTTEVASAAVFTGEATEYYEPASSVSYP